jgi:hypothetical protein
LAIQIQNYFLVGAMVEHLSLVNILLVLLTEQMDLLKTQTDG